METIKINKNKPIYSEEQLPISSMKEVGNVLNITLKAGEKPLMHKGDKIHFKRDVLVEATSAVTRVCETVVNVLEVIPDEKGMIIKVEAPRRGAYEVDAILESDKPAGWARIHFRQDPNLFAQDLEKRSINGISDGITLSNLYISERIPTIDDNITKDAQGKTPHDFLDLSEYLKDMGCENSGNTVERREVFYKPYRQHFDEIYCNIKNPERLVNKFVYFDQNEYYYRDTNGVCKTWEEIDADPNNYNIVRITREVGFWNVSVGTIAAVDDVHLYQEDLVKTKFVEDIASKVIPDVIDMERFKYRPLISLEGGAPIEASGLTFNLHFRTREKENWSYIKSGNTWNNGFRDYKDINDENKKIEEPDLLCNLNFIDTDVEYRKLKVAKSFIRLSFYTSTDVLTQKLLYYSTIFLDSGSLYGKYMKRRTELMEEVESGEIEVDWDDVACVLESCSADTDYKVDTQFNVNNEYNMERCSEGFNIYLFADDADLVDDEEKDYRTIYMKVEFNHAGYGRTLPMIMWPTENGTGVKLTIDNYKDNLYIPVQIRHINDRFFYQIAPTDDKNPCFKIKGQTLVFNLFEPKLYRENGND